MATLNFPDEPTTGDEYYDSNSGFNYEWNGTVWITKDLATPDNTREIDDISSGFDGSDTTFTLKVDGVNIVPKDVKQLVISVGGVMQNPGDDYTVSGSTLTFTTAPLSGLSFTGTFLGVAASLNTITAGSVSPSSLTTTSNYTVGSIKVSGASTIGNFVLTGLTTIADPDVTNFNSSGVGTVSNVILTGDNSGLGATIGAAVGVVTYYGDATNMTGVALSIFPLSYGPGIGSTDQSTSTDITTTWNYPLQAGSGTITIRTGGVEGTIVDQFVVGSSSSITISERTLTLNPAADLSEGTEHFVVYPAGSIKSTSGQKENNQLVTSFTTATTVEQLWMWGKNDKGPLGQNDRTNRSSPVQVPGITWSRVTSGGGTSGNTLATKRDGTLWGWGRNNEGELGQNNRTYYSSPVQIPGTAWTKVIAAGQRQMAAIKTDDTLYTWGRNPSGELGHNNRTQYSSPVQLPGTWAAIASSSYNAIGTKTDGTFWSWGYSYRGALGHNQSGAVRYSSPTQVGTETTWATGVGKMVIDSTTSAIKTDGTMWVWGQNDWGRFGLNYNNSNRSSPVQLPGTTWKSITHVQDGKIASKTDGTLWSWGRNLNGQLGQNNETAYSSPVQIPGTTWSGVTGGGIYYAVATKTDGTLWAWGSNTEGNLGLNQATSTKYSSPVQIGSSTGWSTTVGEQKIANNRTQGNSSYVSGGILYIG